MKPRFSRVAAAMAAIGVGAVLGGAAPAGGALLTPFSMSPTSGPGGTAVSVSGTGCSPGLLLSSSLDRVVVTVSTVPSVTAQMPVTSNGSWSGSLTIPAGVVPGPAPVAALCVSDGLASLLTIYEQKTFTVTAADAPATTAPATTTTLPVSAEQPPPVAPPAGPGPGKTPSTTPGGGSGSPPPAGTPTTAAPGTGSAPPGGGSADPGDSGGGASPGGASRGGSSGKHAETVSAAADLATPTLAAAALDGGGGGLAWVRWLALLLLLAGLVIGVVVFRRLRTEAPAAQ